jgi:hypothetical protein
MKSSTARAGTAAGGHAGPRRSYQRSDSERMRRQTLSAARIIHPPRRSRGRSPRHDPSGLESSPKRSATSSRTSNRKRPSGATPKAVSSDTKRRCERNRRSSSQPSAAETRVKGARFESWGLLGLCPPGAGRVPHQRGHAILKPPGGYVHARGDFGPKFGEAVPGGGAVASWSRLRKRPAGGEVAPRSLVSGFGGPSSRDVSSGKPELHGGSRSRQTLDADPAA